MSTGANVHSLESIESVRVALVKFVDQVRDALANLESEMRRVEEWLDHDRPRFWKNQVRLAVDQAHEAQQALHRCLMFPVADERPSCYEERDALKKAKARLEYCQKKIERVRHWQQTVEHELFEYEGRISKLVRLVEIEVPQSIGVLQKILRHLDEYHAIRGSEPTGEYNDLALVQEIWATPAVGEDTSADDSNEEDPASKAASATANGLTDTKSSDAALAEDATGQED